MFNDDYIRAYEDIEEGGAIPAAIKLKWQTESDKKVRELWAEKERKPQAAKAQREYAEGLELVEAFPVPVKVEPVPIDKAATTPNALKQIQVDLAKLRKHVKEWETAGLQQSHLLQGVAPKDAVGLQGQGPDLPTLQHTAAQPTEAVAQGGVDQALCGRPCDQGITPNHGGLDLVLTSCAPQDRDRPQHSVQRGVEGAAPHLVREDPGGGGRCFQTKQVYVVPSSAPFSRPSVHQGMQVPQGPLAPPQGHPGGNG